VARVWAPHGRPRELSQTAQSAQGTNRKGPRHSPRFSRRHSRSGAVHPQWASGHETGTLPSGKTCPPSVSACRWRLGRGVTPTV